MTIEEENGPNEGAGRLTSSLSYGNDLLLRVTERRSSDTSNMMSGGARSSEQGYKFEFEVEETK